VPAFSRKVDSEQHKKFREVPSFTNYKVMVGAKCNKNSSGDEIANVNFFYDDIAHLLQNTKQENLLRLTN